MESVGWRPHKTGLTWVQKPEKQDHWQCKGRREDRCQLQEAGSKSSLPLFPIQARLHRLGDVREHWVGGLLSSFYQLRCWYHPHTPSETHPENHVSEYLGTLWPGWCHYIRLYCGPHLCLSQGPLSRPHVFRLPWAHILPAPASEPLAPSPSLGFDPSATSSVRLPSTIRFKVATSLTTPSPLPRFILSLALITILYNLFCLSICPK